MSICIENVSLTCSLVHMHVIFLCYVWLFNRPYHIFHYINWCNLFHHLQLSLLFLDVLNSFWILYTPLFSYYNHCTWLFLPRALFQPNHSWPHLHFQPYTMLLLIFNIHLLSRSIWPNLLLLEYSTLVVPCTIIFCFLNPISLILDLHSQLPTYFDFAQMPSFLGFKEINWK